MFFNEPMCLDNKFELITAKKVNCFAEQNDKPESLKRVEKITNKTVQFYNVDIRNKSALSKIFDQHKIDCVMHFAALKAVGESCKIPLTYYQNNITGSSSLFEVMNDYSVKKLVFSSSATGCTNPYGKTKYFVEEILKDLCSSDNDWSVILLRYFNPVGAHESGLMGEDPSGIPNNLMPFISQVAVGRRDKVQVFGSDYPTSDGTGVRDYIHICDLAVGHVKSLDKLLTSHSMVAFEKASARKYTRSRCRRDGDIAASYADAKLANCELGWKAEKDLLAMCADTWRWQSMNPHGFQSTN
ncbi:UDP-galactose 4'-epimerase [Carabus blaptoides fortunei]